MPSYTNTVAAATTTTAVSAPTTGFIRVWSVDVMSTGGNLVTFKSNTTAKYTVKCPTNDVGGLAKSSGREPLFDTAAGEDLNFTTSTADSCSVNFWYSLVGN